MEILQSISLDFGRDTLPITVFAKQNDQNSRFVKITPLNCGQTYTLDSGITARLQLTKPDGHTVIDDATMPHRLQTKYGRLVFAYDTLTPFTFRTV